MLLLTVGTNASKLKSILFSKVQPALALTLIFQQIQPGKNWCTQQFSPAHISAEQKTNKQKTKKKRQLKGIQTSAQPSQYFIQCEL